MAKPQDLSGQIFGRLTVISLTHKNSRTAWSCRCSCGVMAVVVTAHLKNGATRSCGCLRTELIRLPAGENCFNQLIDQYRRNAKKRGREFSLTVDEFRKLATSNCHYCDGPPSLIKKSYGKRPSYGTFTYNGVDRRDNSGHYTLDNCLSCCKTCNYMKGRLNYDEFIAHLNLLFERRAVLCPSP